MAILPVIYLLTFAFLLVSVSAAPEEDLVLIPIAGYNNHRWYSGIY